MTPEDATVSLDGETLHHDPSTPLRLDPGTHELVVSASRYNTEQRHIKLDPGIQRSLSVRLTETRENQSAQPAPLTAPAPARAQTNETPVAIKVMTISGLAVAVIGATIGSIAGAQVIANKDELDRACPAGVCPLSQQQSISKQLSETEDLETLMTASFVAAGAGLAVGLTGLVLWASSGDDDQTTEEASNLELLLLLTGPLGTCF